MTTYIWDTTLLHHAHRCERLDVLGDLAGAATNLVTEVVAGELSHVGAALPPWVELREFDHPEDLRTFALGGNNVWPTRHTTWVRPRRWPRQR